MAAAHAGVSSPISKRYAHLLAIYFLAFSLTANLITKTEIFHFETTVSAPHPHWLNSCQNMRLRPKRYLGSRVPYSTNGTSFFQLEKIFSCGDVSRNPSPKGMKKEPTVKLWFACSECKKCVKFNQDAILCASCTSWSQVKCLGMTKTMFQYYLKHPELDDSLNCKFCSTQMYKKL